MSGHPIVHVEIPATDPKAAGAFYADVFGWNVHTDPSFDYTMFQAEGGPGGGFVGVSEGDPSNPMGNKVNEPLIYIGTDDIESTLRTIEAHGGEVLVQKTEIPQTGWFGIIRDPSGNRVAHYTALQQA